MKVLRDFEAAGRVVYCPCGLGRAPDVGESIVFVSGWAGGGSLSRVGSIKIMVVKNKVDVAADEESGQDFQDADMRWFDERCVLVRKTRCRW